MTDIEIAQGTALLPIADVAASIGIPEEALEPYGAAKAKVSESFLREAERRPHGKLVLVTAVSPTPAGEGKTTTTIGLGDALARLRRKAVVALREPSLGPVFGIKGGAAGGGRAQVAPMEDINLHFTGDMHAVTAANNLLSALIDNHLHQGDSLEIDPGAVLFSRCMDMNDRSLREVEVGLGNRKNGIPRKDGFLITVASEIMAILCLARDLTDLKERLGGILIARTFGGRPVYARDLHAEGAMTALLRDAVKPNLVQTLEHTPCLVHGGPFANIAHGCNSVRATRLALQLGEYAVTEAGFGSDLGAEKFMDIKCPTAGLAPNAVVLVVSARALKYNGGVPKERLGAPDSAALGRGMENLDAHLDALAHFGVPLVVAVNRFPSDTREELDAVLEHCRGRGTRAELSEVHEKGGEGGLALARAVLKACDEPTHYAPLCTPEMTVTEKITAIATKIYGAGAVEYAPEADGALRRIEAIGAGRYPVCIAKTQYSLSDDAGVLGRPRGFTLHVRDLRLSAGARFVVALTGSVLTMPGLPKVPAAEGIDVTPDGRITGLF